MVTTTDSDKTGKEEQDTQKITASQPLRPMLIKLEPQTYRVEKNGEYLFVYIIVRNLSLPMFGTGAKVYLTVTHTFNEYGYTRYEELDSYMGPLIFFKHGISEHDYELANRIAKRSSEYINEYLAFALQSWRESKYVQIEMRRDFTDMEAEIVREALKEHSCQHPSELPPSHPVRQWYDGCETDYSDAVMDVIKGWKEGDNGL